MSLWSIADLYIFEEKDVSNNKIKKKWKGCVNFKLSLYKITLKDFRSGELPGLVLDLALFEIILGVAFS